jgi:hypothetical protein
MKRLPLQFQYPRTYGEGSGGLFERYGMYPGCKAWGAFGLKRNTARMVLQRHRRDGQV